MKMYYSLTMRHKNWWWWWWCLPLYTERQHSVQTFCNYKDKYILVFWLLPLRGRHSSWHKLSFLIQPYFFIQAWDCQCIQWLWFGHWVCIEPGPGQPTTESSIPHKIYTFLYCRIIRGSCLTFWIFFFYFLTMVKYHITFFTPTQEPLEVHFSGANYPQNFISRHSN